MYRLKHLAKESWYGANSNWIEATGAMIENRDGELRFVIQCETGYGDPEEVKET